MTITQNTSITIQATCTFFNIGLGLYSLNQSRPDLSCISMFAAGFCACLWFDLLFSKK